MVELRHTIDSVEISSLGNAVDYGDLTVARMRATGTFK